MKLKDRGKERGANKRVKRERQRKGGLSGKSKEKAAKGQV